MRIQQLPESPMLHGHVIPRNHTEGTNACRPKRRVQLGWAHIKFPFWCCFSSTTDREVHRGEPPGPVGLGTLGTCGMMGKGRIPHEVWEKTPNQPMKQNPKGNNQTSPKAISQSSPEGGRSTWEKDDTHWGHPHSFSSSARGHFMARLWGFSHLTQISTDWHRLISLQAGIYIQQLSKVRKCKD